MLGPAGNHALTVQGCRAGWQGNAWHQRAGAGRLRQDHAVKTGYCGIGEIRIFIGNQQGVQHARTTVGGRKYRQWQRGKGAGHSNTLDADLVSTRVLLA